MRINTQTFFWELSNHSAERVALETDCKTLPIVLEHNVIIIKNRIKKPKLPSVTLLSYTGGEDRIDYDFSIFNNVKISGIVFCDSIEDMCALNFAWKLFFAFYDLAKNIAITCIDDFLALFKNFIQDLAPKDGFLSIS